MDKSELEAAIAETKKQYEEDDTLKRTIEDRMHQRIGRFNTLTELKEKLDATSIKERPVTDTNKRTGK